MERIVRRMPRICVTDRRIIGKRGTVEMQRLVALRGRLPRYFEIVILLEVPTCGGTFLYIALYRLCLW